MKTFKTRHQLFLTEHLSKRLNVIARNSGCARSDILVEALEAWFDRRGGPDVDEAVFARLRKIDGGMAKLNRSVDLLWEGMSRLVKHQLVVGASLPPITDAARALGAQLHQNFIDEIAERRNLINTQLFATDDETSQRDENFRS